MPKSYKITHTDVFDSTAFPREGLNFTKQMSLPATVPGPETKIYLSDFETHVRDYIAYCIDHEYSVSMSGRLYDDGRPFSKFIAKGKIMAYQSQQENTMLLCGKKADVLDFCRNTKTSTHIKLTVLRVDMEALQEKLVEVRGGWFRSRAGYMGSQIQDTPEFIAAKAEGSISTLSFYFEDARSGELPHPILITEDGTVVLQRNYRHVDEELEFVLYIKTQLLDGICEAIEVGKSKAAITGL